MNNTLEITEPKTEISKKTISHNDRTICCGKIIPIFSHDFLNESMFFPFMKNWQWLHRHGLLPQRTLVVRSGNMFRKISWMHAHNHMHTNTRTHTYHIGWAVLFMPRGVAGRVELVQVLGARVGGSRGRRQQQLPVLVLLQYEQQCKLVSGCRTRCIFEKFLTCRRDINKPNKTKLECIVP